MAKKLMANAKNWYDVTVQIHQGTAVLKHIEGYVQAHSMAEAEEKALQQVVSAECDTLNPSITLVVTRIVCDNAKSE